jgi:Arm domain-containing DNA-binding protein
MTGTENPDGHALAATDFLTEARLRSARPKARPYKLRDGGGLYLPVTPAGAKQWRLRYTLGGRKSMVSLGTYPATSLKGARAKRTEVRAALEAGKNPSAERRAERVSSEQHAIRCVPAVTQVPSRNSHVSLAATSSDAPPPRMADVNF